jgi:DNA uptake protein ComE-like DNA-binding protein
MKRILILLVAVLAMTIAGTARPDEKNSSASAAGPAKSAQIDINSATTDQLKAIQGIGDAYAAKIIASRPYKSKYELVQRKILPGHVYDKIKDQIIAKQK